MDDRAQQVPEQGARPRLGGDGTVDRVQSEDPGEQIQSRQAGPQTRPSPPCGPPVPSADGNGRARRPATETRGLYEVSRRAVDPSRMGAVVPSERLVAAQGVAMRPIRSRPQAGPDEPWAAVDGVVSRGTWTRAR